MLEESKNYCVFKIFGVTFVELESGVSSMKKEGIKIEISQSCLDSRVVVENISATEADFFEILKKINICFEGKIYSESDCSLAECIVNNSLKKGIKISLAESITGGMIASSLVDIPGSSNVLVEALVTYTDQAKVRRLHVKLRTLEKFGVVSAEVAKEMTGGLLENNSVSLSLSTTGCAGPSSDGYDTPIGLSYISIGDKENISAQKFLFDGTRNYIRSCVKETALYMLLTYINKKR